MSEPKNLGMAAAVAGGYLLGRSKKGQMALTAAAMLAGRGLRPHATLPAGVRRIPGIPGGDGGGEEETAEADAGENTAHAHRGGLTGAARTAASAVTDRGLTALGGALQERTRRLTDGADGSGDGEDDGSGDQAGDRAGDQAGDRADDSDGSDEAGETADVGTETEADTDADTEADTADADADDAERPARPRPRARRPRSGSTGAEPPGEGGRAAEAKPAARKRPAARKSAEVPARAARKSGPARGSAADKSAAKSRTTQKPAARPQRDR